MTSQGSLLRGLGNSLLINLAQCTTITLLYGAFSTLCYSKLHFLMMCRPVSCSFPIFCHYSDVREILPPYNAPEVTTGANRRRGLTSRPAWLMLGATLTSFVCVSLYWGAFLATFILDIRGTLVDNSDAPLNNAKFVAVARQEFAADQITLWAPLVLVREPILYTSSSQN